MTFAIHPGWIKGLPKVELHCHLIGTVRPATFAELAQRERLSLPDEPEKIFRDINSLPPDPELYRNTVIPVPEGPSLDEPEVSYSLFQASKWVIEVLRSADDLTRIVYEAFQDAHMLSNVRHLELFFDDVPKHLASLGYLGSVEAYAEGIRLAERDFGMTGRLIKGIDRSKSADVALAQVREVVENPHEYVAGIGLDNLETSGPPERFTQAYQLAGQAGLRRTAHASEHVPSAQNTITCLDILGCDRIDHGYYVLQDPEVVARLRGEGTLFTVAATTSRRSWRPWRRASIAAMLEAGLSVTPCSDDPGMFPTTLTNEYAICAEQIGASARQLRDMVFRAVDGCWLPTVERKALAERVAGELAVLDAEYGFSAQMNSQKLGY